jgi:hypothetical protein
LNSYPDSHSERLKKGLDICRIAFEALFEDTKRLVTVGVRANIAHHKARASSGKESSKVFSRSDTREKNLERWLKCRNPLSYGERDGMETFELLLEAVSSEEDSISDGLENWHEFGTTRYEFAKSLVEMSRPVNPSAVKAPVARNGCFLPVLKIAHKSLISLAKECESNEEKQKEFVLDTMTKAVKEFKINFFPAPKAKSGSAGAPNSKPVWNSWGNLGHKEKKGVRIGSNLGSGGSRGTVHPARVAYNNAVANDSNAQWTAKTLTLKTLKKALCKTSLPEDYKLPQESKEEYVNETYRWVKDNYNGTKAVHHLALLVAIIVASSLLPNLFMPIGLKWQFVNAKTPEEVRKVFDEMEWISKEKKGMSDKAIFICMFTTLIIGIYEKESPLRKHMESAERKGLGDGWMNKHSKCQKGKNLISSKDGNLQE